MKVVNLNRRRKKKERAKACEKVVKIKKDREEAFQEFRTLLELANEYLKEAEELQKKYKL